jgi:hypothetical protein
MSSNHKLTAVLHGRTITGSAVGDDQLTIRFDDGSVMTIYVATGSSVSPTSGTVDKVRQDGDTLDLDMTDGISVTIETAEPTACIIVRNKRQVIEYAD